MNTKSIGLILLTGIFLLLFYEFVYKDYAYKKDVLARRDQLLSIIRPAEDRLSEIEPKADVCAARMSDLYVREVLQITPEDDKICNQLQSEVIELREKDRVATIQFQELDAGVKQRFGGPPSWWR